MRILKLIRWTVRIIGTLILSLFVLLAAGEGFPQMDTLPLVDRLSFLSLAGICIGCLIGWRWEIAAGILILSSFLSFSLLQQVFLINMLFGPVIAVGTAYLILGITKRRGQ